jgi:hypothetical protein
MTVLKEATSFREALVANTHYAVTCAMPPLTASSQRIVLATGVRAADAAGRPRPDQRLGRVSSSRAHHPTLVVFQCSLVALA